MAIHYEIPMIIPKNISDETTFHQALSRKLLADCTTSILMLWTSSCLVIRRLHDRDRSGWWNMIWIFYISAYFAFDYLGYLVEAHADSDGFWHPESTIFGLIFPIVFLPVYIGYMLELWFRRGTPGPNRFGPDPLG
jgi:uncharacterized membrane protein YhaH (DUF805 family)